MIKLQDFARQMGVTDRMIQKHLKTYAAELEGHYERKGPNGTWLDDKAQEIIRSKMRQNPVAVFEEDPRVEQLQSRVSELEKLLAEKEKLLALSQQATQEAQSKVNALLEDVQKVALLESGKAEAEQKAAEAERLAVSVRQEKNEVELALTAVEKENKTLSDVAEANAQEAERAKKAAEDLQGELDRRQAELDAEKTKKISFREYWKRRKG